ncbi:hypothetical protein HZB60_06540 [candidate division KSB1 bacterium]|nr:hypothetical protein [candidate division KSB1 bacterium]
MRRQTRAQSGISMLEVMVTMFLIMIGLLVVMSAMVATAKSSRYSQRMETANSLLRMEMERVKNMDWPDIASETAAYGEFADHPDFRHTLSVTEDGRIKRIELTILFEQDRRSAVAITSISDM